MAAVPIRRRADRFSTYLVIGAVLAAGALPAVQRSEAQTVAGPATGPHVIIPQCYRSAAGRRRPIQVTKVQASISIIEQVATTTIDISIKNNASRRETAELLVPVPDGAAIRAFAFEGSAASPTARVLEKDEAKATFDAIVRKLKDPALMEFAGFNLIRTSVFPVEPQGTQTLRVTYEHLLTADGDRGDKIEPAKVVEFGSPEFLELAWILVKQGRQGSVSLDGDMLVNINGEAILIKAAAVPQQKETSSGKTLTVR